MEFEILEYVKKHPGCGWMELYCHFGKTYRLRYAFRRCISRLMADGAIVHIEPDAKGCKRRWRLHIAQAR